MHNLEIYPIHINEGSGDLTLPGLLVLAPPRKCARGREFDQLIALIHLTGEAEFTSDVLQTWLQKKAALFYSVPGSVTHAMRMMAEAINNELLDRNNKKAAIGAQVFGSLSMVVIRKEMTYSLVIGQAHIFTLTKTEVVEQVDQENHDKGLGVDEAITCLFKQTNLTSGDSLLIAGHANPYWIPETLQNTHALTGEALGSRLLRQQPANLRAAFVRLSEGKGVLEFKSFMPKQSEAVKNADELSSDFKASDEGTDSPIEKTEQAKSEDLTEVEIHELPGIIPTEGEVAEEELIQNEPEVVAAKTDTSPSTENAEVNEPQRSIKDWLKKKKEPKTDQEKSDDRVEESRLKKIKTINPDAITVPRYMYLLLAIAIPVLVVIVAISVYINQGRSQQFNYYLGEGRKYAQEAEIAKGDPVMYSFNLQAAQMWLQKANQYGVNDESTKLLTTVQAQLDQLQGVVRLSMMPMVSDERLNSANITQMVATNTDLYMLDSNSGKALHFDLVGDEYIYDEGFDCGPNPNNPLNQISKLVDIIGLPVGNSFGATLFGIDAFGNTEFCIPDESGVVSSLIAPDAGWQEIKAISMYQNYLYVLDPGNNGVFIYYGRGILFEEKPSLFFDNIIPDMKSAVDIEVYADELYVLRSSGEIVECTYSYLKDYKPTVCTDPAPFYDTRQGQDPETITFSESQFVQLRMTPAPDSSLYLLDARGNGIYHFSLLRNLQKIMQPSFSDPEYSPKNPVTSVAFSPGRTIFMAFGNQVYTTVMP